MYLNSGDWIENLTALELENGAWKIYQYDEKEFLSVVKTKPDYTVPKPDVIPDQVTEFIDSLVLSKGNRARKKII